MDNLVNYVKILKLSVKETLKRLHTFLLLYKNKDTNIPTINDLGLKIFTISNKLSSLPSIVNASYGHFFEYLKISVTKAHYQLDKYFVCCTNYEYGILAMKPY